MTDQGGPQPHTTESSTDAKPAVPQRRDARTSTKLWIVAVFFLLGSNLVTYFLLTDRIDRLERLRRYDGIDMSAQKDQRPRFTIINGHDHLYKRSHLPKYLQAAERTGVDRTLFVASNGYTLLGDKKRMHDLYDWNIEEILDASHDNPGKIIPFGTLDPEDPNKLEKLKRYERQGIDGLKLYSGHGNMYTLALDHEDMLPIYAFCQEEGLPILWHVRFDRYLKQFVNVLDQFPDLKVIVPHFGVAFYRPKSPGWQQLQDLLDRYPNLYIDCSFGTRAILVHGLEIVSENRELFRSFFERYSEDEGVGRIGDSGQSRLAGEGHLLLLDGRESVAIRPEESQQPLWETSRTGFAERRSAPRVRRKPRTDSAKKTTGNRAAGRHQSIA
ncbi:MAG: amidohydrolase family protein [Candidatus Hydrogenedentes bacterium]|nr:amidohydrolase family protein [Candidatus Hydrogenedentota bacterium]